MAECRCGVCEHCTNSLIGLVASLEPRAPMPRKLISRTEMADIRASWLNECPAFARLLAGYETAAHLLEEVVRASRDLEHITSGPTLVNEIDVAWLALREAEK